VLATDNPSPVYNAIAADLLLVLHLGFICFVLAGGLLVLKWRWLAILHLPAVVWGALVEIQGWLCPLTPWEQQLRQAAGQAGYRGGFVEHYLLPVLYPPGLEHNTQLILGGAVILINAIIYGWIFLRRRE
jgi:hypothetical protein